MKELTPEQLVIRNCYLVCEMALDLNVDDLISSYQRADAFGCFFDPTAWMNSQSARAEDLAVLNAVKSLQAGLRERHPALVEKMLGDNRSAAEAQPIFSPTGAAAARMNANRNPESPESAAWVRERLQWLLDHWDALRESPDHIKGTLRSLWHAYTDDPFDEERNG